MPRKLTDEQEARLCRLIEHSGMTYKEIATHYGVTLSLVKAVAERNGLTRERNPWTWAEDALLRRHYAELGARYMAEHVFGDTHPNPECVCHRAGQLGLTDHSRYRR